MRFTALMLVCIFIIAAPALAQAPAPKPKSAKPAPPSVEKIGNDFVRKAILALKAIERDSAFPTVKSTQLAIDEADSEAVTDSEIAISKTISRLLSDHLLNNGDRTLILLRLQNALIGQRGDPDVLLLDAAAKSSELQAISSREAACFEPFEEALRQRLSVVPDSCRSIR